MRLTIVPSDNLVLIDGERRIVDCAGFASLRGIHAVQWIETTGHIEFLPESAQHRANELIASTDRFQEVVDAWYAAKPTTPTI